MTGLDDQYNGMVAAEIRAVSEEHAQEGIDVAGPATTDRYWSTVVDRRQYRQDIVTVLDRVADLARAGDWTKLLPLLGRPVTAPGPEWINTPRVGTRRGYASLHQAAWHGADRDVMQRLLELGAWRSMRTVSGRLPIDIARERGHRHLDVLLAPPVVDEFPERRRRALGSFLDTLVTVRIRSFGLDGSFRLPQIGPVLELGDGQRMWCGVPGMHGGFELQRDGEEILVASWSRIDDGSEQDHRVTSREVRLVSDGIAGARRRWGIG